MNITDEPITFGGFTACDDMVSEKDACFDYIISLTSISILFIVSEVLPFLRASEGNGLTDCMIKSFEMSECCLSSLLKCLKKEKGEDDDPSLEVNTKLTTQQETDMKNNININIGGDISQK